LYRPKGRLLFDSTLSRGEPTVREEGKAAASVSADVGASLEINHSTESMATRGDKKMTEQTTAKTDHLKVQAKGSIVISIIVGLALLLATGLTAHTPSHG